MKIKRLDHLGIVAGVIDDLKIVEDIDNIFPTHDYNEISYGEAVKGMIMNGLGFSNRALSLSPQFFENIPVELLFREGVKPEHFNRHKLSRTLDKCFEFGCESLFSKIAYNACEIENVEKKFNSTDTTNYSLSGSYDTSYDDENDDSPVPVNITYGHSKAHRPDLKQVAQEIMVTQDGGIPILCKILDGNAADTRVFKERTSALIDEFKKSKTPKYLIADCKLYTKANADFLNQIPFITLIPGALSRRKELIVQCLSENHWIKIDDNYQYVSHDITHNEIDQRWLVFYSNAAKLRVEKTIIKKIAKEKESLKKQFFHFQASRFECKPDAEKALIKALKNLKYHQKDSVEFIEHKNHKRKGRPKKEMIADKIKYQVKVTVKEDQKKIDAVIDQKSCFVLTTNIQEKELSDLDVLSCYKGQSHVERGFRFLKDPLFFTSSFFLDKPSRIEALLMVMTLALLVYSIAQRRMRNSMKKLNQSIPNQIKVPTATPTLRWVFQCFEGVNTVQFKDEYNYKELYMDGLTELRKRIVQYIGGATLHYYKIEKMP